MPEVQDKKALLKKLLEQKAKKAAAQDAPLSYGQQALWFLNQNAPDNTAYNVAFAARIRSAVDLEAFKKACQRLINRHPVLRTTYTMKNGKLVQTVHGYMDVDFSLIDVTGRPNEIVDRRVQEAYAESFDLAQGPLVKVSMFKQAADNFVLLFNIHHIACDGFSTWVMLDELKELYSATIENRKAELPPIKLTYVDFVKKQRDGLEGEKGEKQLAYWKEVFKNGVSPLDLPTDFTRPSFQQYNGASSKIVIPNTLTDQLRALGKKEGATLFGLLTSAFQVLLYRYTGQEEVIIGTPTSGRSQEDWKKVVGYFVNPVPLKATFDGNPSFSDFLQQNKKDILQAIAHQDLPFPYLVEKLQIPRDQSRSPIFQVFFSLLKSEGDKAVQALLSESGEQGVHDWGKLQIEAYDLPQQEGQFDLTIALNDSAGELSGKFKYNPDLFTEATIDRMKAHFVQLLQAIVQNPAKPVREYFFLSEEELKRWIVDYNQTAKPFPQDICMHHVFEQRVDKTPDLIAVSMPALEAEGKKSTYTFAELDKRANQVAHYLQAEGVKPEDKIGLCTHRSIDMIVGILGILKSGGAYVPLDPEYPTERLAYICEDAGISKVLTGPGAESHLPESGIEKVRIEEGVNTFDSYPDTRPTSSVQPNNLAYIIYTSGSTGKPKGVLIEHRGVVNKLINFKEDLKVDPSYRFTLLASYAFDASIGQMMLPMVSGAPLFLMTKDEQTDPVAFWDFIEANGINVFYTVASFLSPMLDAPRDFSNLEVKAILLGAEVFPKKLLHKIQEKLSAQKIINMYGPTETTVNCVMYNVEDIPEGPIPIGVPLPNYTAYILDEQLNVCPVGVPGEIHVGGPAVARGYHNRPELTAERFIPDPFSKIPGARLYKSGDLGKYLPNGNIGFVGRVDKQIKVNGYRIEPGEVELALMKHGSIKDVLVTAKNDASGNQRLVAYLIAADCQLPEGKHLTEFLKKSLPSFMVPSAFIPMDAFPLLPSGKVDMKKLPLPGSTPTVKTEYVAPRTDEESYLVNIWKEVLALEKIGVRDNFFELGGASVQSIQVVNKANEIGFKLSAAMLFEYQTIESLAEAAAPNFEYIEPGTATVEEVVVEETPEPTNLRPSIGIDKATSIVESVGTYLPPDAVTTEELLDGCKVDIRFPLKKMTGIQTRRMAGEEEFAIDLAKQAAKACLERSKYDGEDIELLICCNISRYDAPKQVSYEPSTAAKLRKHFGMKKAMVFDLSNACATMWTGINILDAFIRNGIVNRGMVVSGEYITHIAKTAMEEIEDTFMDPRMACLTVGDSGAAVLLERSPDPALGFHSLHMYTETQLCRNCIANISDQKHGGAIMYVDSVKAAASAIQPGASLVLNMIEKENWLADERFDYFLMHQTSSTTISDSRRELNSQYNKEIATKENTIDNIAHRGNTATTSHWLAMVDQVRNNTIKSGQKIVFGISGSGHTLGTALYTLDDLPDRILGNKAPAPKADNGQAEVVWKTNPAQRVAINSIGILPEAYEGPVDSLEFMKAAAKDCIAQSDYHKNEVGLIINTGIYRNKFLSEPAMAALMAGDLGINAHPTPDSPNKSFTFDLMNGSLGFLEGIYTSIQMINAGKFNTAMVTAAEIENNLEYRPDDLLGLRETGSAMLLHPSTDGEGFGNFLFKTYPAYMDSEEINLTWKDGESYLQITKNPNLASFYVHCIQDAIKAFLQQENRRLSDYDLILPPQVSPAFIAELSVALDWAPNKFLDVSEEGKDLYTSSVPYALHAAKTQGKVTKGSKVLIVAAGAGIQVGCAEYGF